MTAVAIICEYNPFHTGHAYHIDEAKKLGGADYVLGIMSGCFVQRAEPSCASPAVRAKAAISCGMDAVIELPSIYSCASGNLFADGALRILSRIKSVKYLAMGVENKTELIFRIAEIQANEPTEFTLELKRLLQNGIPYAAAISSATVKTAGEKYAQECEAVLSKPNNVLAIEYVKAIIKHKLDITPLFIERKGNDYNDDSPKGEFISATAARTLLREARFAELKDYIPADCLEELVAESGSHAVNYGAYNALTLYALRTKDINKSFDCGEGLDVKLKECALARHDLNDAIAACKSKRYTLSRIKRVCVQTLLNITKDVMRIAPDACGRLIAIKNSRLDLMKNLTGICVKNSDYAKYGENAELVAQTDGLAGSVYSLITERDGNSFWDRKLITL